MNSDGLMPASGSPNRCNIPAHPLIRSGFAPVSHDGVPTFPPLAEARLQTTPRGYKSPKSALFLISQTNSRHSRNSRAKETLRLCGPFLAVKFHHSDPFRVFNAFCGP